MPRSNTKIWQVAAKEQPAAKKSVTMESLAGLQDAAVINSVYLDNPDKDMYHERTGIEGPKVYSCSL